MEGARQLPLQSIHRSMVSILMSPQQLQVVYGVATTALHRLPRTPRCHRSFSASLPFKSRRCGVHSSQSRNGKGESRCYGNET